MAPNVEELIGQMHDLEVQIQAAYEQKRKDVQFVVEKGRIRFGEALTQQHRLKKISVFRFLRDASVLSIITAPVIYAGWLPLALLDLYCVIYQAICFPAYGIAKVSRSDYLVFDRASLAYLNPIQRFNCFYCSYANGLTAYYREIAARTEQYHCPIKHSQKLASEHERYPDFFEFGDAETYRRELERLQLELKDENGR
jgi:hypothetical protein